MPIDPEHLRKHYASLSDEELAALNRDDLTDVAQKYYDWEFKRRGITTPTHEERDGEQEVTFRESDDEEEPSDTDADTMFVASSFIVDRSASAVGDAEDARRALISAGIPCKVEMHEIGDEPVPYEGQVEQQVLVPVEFTLRATSVLDREIFNPKMEADWKTHLQALSDDQLLKLNADDICAGLLDRAERLRQAYQNEVRRRKL